MTNQQTIDKLREMRLTAMAEQFLQQTNQADMKELTFDDRFGMIVDYEYSTRKNNRRTRLIKKATFDQGQAHVAAIDYTAPRKLNKDLITRLATCTFIKEKHNVIIMGATGSGKSYIACALGMEACKNYHTVKYIRLPELLAELQIARGAGMFMKTAKQYRSVDLLIIDEWMLVALNEYEARDLLEIIHVRHKRASTMFCSQFQPAGWHKKIGEETIADAILDRIVHDSYTIEIQSATNDDRSMREVYGLKDK
jgi:DNA replication protein DnaC